MRKIINNLRDQPEAVRRHILHVLTFVAGIILIILWIYSLGKNLSSPDTQAKINNDLKPLNALKANLIGGYNSLNQ
ncbi:hypothetical protein A2917_01940 [Candidatus Nomurabacteria bacterium RIFCSPLOWO2_01_FULL_42_17]|uniref:Uncharacterized protein n=1 Tax=Candidatus Nomurabacteria bacterium RIFCSPLOWO2_01_FULL_42_17 TaxID=1801780 RepID=A0A1F6XLB9_9BACT|nr:MAG: hypothetical protein A2917_01940 [Candidatus Nomurabacteria bacterium RIFCSPLOWO2_01_FULL_42_17]